MKHKNWTTPIVALGLLASFGIAMFQIQSAARAAPTLLSQENYADISDDLQRVPDSDVLPNPTPTPDPAMAVLYPEELDPPESCGVPQRGPFGQDAEILIGPWRDRRVTYQLYLNPSWYNQQTLPGTDPTAGPTPTPGATPVPEPIPTSDFAAVALGTERIVATWAGSGGALFYDTWSASSGWPSEPSFLDQTTDGNPAILSRNAYNWVIFARVGSGIKFREMNYDTLGVWMDLAGVAGSASAASDPVVISKDPHHMAVFYRDESGAVWFTEGMLGGEGTADQSILASAQVTTTIWRTQPVSLSGIELVHQIYLPLVMKNLSGTSFIMRGPAAHEAYIPLGVSDAFRLTSELSVASRNENHLAVFGVDANHQLWVKEWTNHKESDWSDTAWVKLMDDVMVERPAVTSRHSNHLGVAVRDTSGVPWYIEWTYTGGWKTPISLSGTRSSPLTIAAPSIDTLTIFSVEGNQIWHKDWNETEGWGHWQAFADTNVQNDQILTAIARQMNDLMLLGRRTGAGFYKHFTALGQDLRESVVAPGAAVSAHAGDQALAWVDGKTLWVGADQDQVMTDTWSVEALILTDGITASLALPMHPWWGAYNQRSTMAAGDVDFDGDDEIVIATATSTTPTFSISILDFVVSPTLSITVTSTVTRHYQTAGEPDQGTRLDVAIGDLDGDGRQDEVAMSYHLNNQPYVDVFEYMAATNTLDYRGRELFAHTPGVVSQDVRTTIGQVFDRHPVHGRLSAEQLIVASSYISTNRAVHTKVYSVSLTSPDWSFIELDALDGHDIYSSARYPWINLTTGDLDADGLEEIVYARSGAVYVIDYDRSGDRHSPPVFFEGVADDKVIHTVGDVDQDGKAEIVYWTEDDRVAVLELVDESTLHLSGSILPTVQDGELLIGDLDNDSFRSELAGCTNFSEVSVIAVLNGAPRCYVGGMPVQNTDVRYAKTASGGSSSAWGTTTNLGGFMSVGFEVEINVPFIGTKLGEVRGSVTQDFMASQGQTRAVEESVTLSSGYNNEEGTTLGIVVYNGTDYKCYYYDIYPPAAPAQKSRAMVCRPIGNAYEDFYSLEQWHSESFKQQAGTSWVDVGHHTAGGAHTNDANTYPSGLPVDPYLLRHTWPTAPFRVNYDVSGGYTDWSITQMQGASQESSQSFETNTTVSAGATAGVVTVDAGVTVGFGWDESRSVSWSNELEIGGAIYKISNPAFQTCVYTAVPYIYHAKATSVAGVTYPYLEMDYYVPSLEGNCTALSGMQAVPPLLSETHIPR